MKNILSLATPSLYRREVSIHGESKRTRKLSLGSDAFIDDHAIALRSFRTELQEETDTNDKNKKFTQDINSNTLLHTQPKQSTLRRLKSWNKGFTRQSKEIEESTIQSLKESLQRSSRRSSYRKESVDSTQTVNKSKQKCATPPTQRRKISADLRELIVEKPLRKLSSSTALRKYSEPSKPFIESDEKERSLNLGNCYSPDKMKSWEIVMEKLSSTIKHTNNATYKRCQSISETLGTLKEPSKKKLSHSLSGSVKKRRKSNDFHRRSQQDRNSINSQTISSDDEASEASYDLSLNREAMDYDNFLNSSALSTNLWYHGELDILHVDCNKEETLVGSLLARVDRYGDVVYSITYSHGTESYIGSLPSQNGRYCLDFTDPQQPRFRSAKCLIGYLIEQKYIERVTFSWLIDNCEKYVLE